MIKTTIIKRLKATSIHLSLSAIAFFVVLYFILLYWYPRPHFAVNGGWQGVRIMLFVDIVLGPFLTLILFNPAKSLKAIVFDLSMIATIQISAFTWGVYAVHSQRPVAMSLWNGVIYPVLEEELKIQEKTPVYVRQFDDGKPPVVFIREAATEEEQAGAFSYNFIEGISEAKLFFLFDPIKQHIPELFQASLENIKIPPKKFNGIKQEYIQKHGYKEGEIAFVPFEGKYGYSLLIFNRAGNVIDSIPDPRYGDYSSLFF